MAMKPDPEIPADGTCYVCGEERPKLAIEHDDPFCKTECTNAFHGVVYAWKEKEAVTA